MAGAAAYDNKLLEISLMVSGNDLSAASDQFIFVKCGNTEGDVVPAAAGDCPLGISQETGKDGESISVCVAGISKIRLAGTVKRGNILNVYTGANVGTAVRSDQASEAIGAMAMMDGSSGDVISCLLIQGFAS